MFGEFLDQLVIGLAIVVMTIVTPFVIKWLRAMEVKAKEACKSDYGDKWLSRLFDLSVEVVNATNGTYVQAIKTHGVLSEAQKIEAFNRTKKALTNILADTIEDAKLMGIADIDTLIDVAIESAVEKLKTR